MVFKEKDLLESAGVFGVSTAWDNKWFVEVQHNSDSWVVEMKIPFKAFDTKKMSNRELISLETILKVMN